MTCCKNPHGGEVWVFTRVSYLERKVFGQSANEWERYFLMLYYINDTNDRKYEYPQLEDANKWQQ